MNNTLYGATTVQTTSATTLEFYHPKNGTVIHSHVANGADHAYPVRDGNGIRFYWLNNGSATTFVHDVDLLHIHPDWTTEYHSYSKTLLQTLAPPRVGMLSIYETSFHGFGCCRVMKSI